jgi:hypothetical protein
MAFDLNSVPPNARSKQSIAAHLEIYERTQDVIRVHNPTDKDFIVYNDRRFANERYVIPNKDKDIGYGKGNNDVLRFIAQRFVDKLGNEMIAKIIADDWAKKKGKFRLEEQGQMEERLALRSSDPKLWEDITKKLWIGVVKRYQGEMIDEPEAKGPRKEYTSSSEEALDRLGMTDMEIEAPRVEPKLEVTAKDKFAESIT